MNYYSFHIGDYLTRTSHLTLVEHGAYRRLMDVYYSTEKALPGDIKAIHRLVMARTKEERDAVEAVLNEFFELIDGEWRQHRCDHEILLCNKNRTNGKKGGRPPKNNNPDETQTEPKDNPDETQTEPNTKAPITHYPLPITQEESTTLSGKPDPAKSEARKKLSEECAEVLAFLNEKTGRNYQPVKANIQLIASRLREGATVIQLRQVIAKKCREWRDDPKQEIYLRPKTLFNATNFANYQGELVA